MAVVSCIFGGMIGMLSALVGGIFFDFGFWGAAALFFGVGNALAVGLMLATLMLMPARQMPAEDAQDAVRA